MGKNTGGQIKSQASGTVFPKGLSDEGELFALAIRRRLNTCFTSYKILFSDGNLAFPPKLGDFV